MLVLRTLFLWLAFAVLLFLECNFLPDSYLRISAMIRLVPSLLLLGWFVIYLFTKDKYIVNRNTPRFIVNWLTVLKSVANIAIVSGALMRIFHYQYAQLLLVIGIGFLALWSSILTFYSMLKSDFDPNIIDDVEDEESQDGF